MLHNFLHKIEVSFTEVLQYKNNNYFQPGSVHLFVF